MRLKNAWKAMVTGLFFLWTSSAFGAVTQEDLMRRLEDLSTLIQKQQEEIQKMQQEMQRQKENVEKGNAQEKEEIKKVVKEETDKKEKEWQKLMPDWTKRISISADLRLRYEGIYDRDQLQKNLTTTDLPDRDTGKFRLRLFVDGTVTDEISAHVMLVTNQDTHQEAPTSNQTLGYDFNDKGIFIGRAYATYKPKWLNGLELTGGKFRNAFYHTDIMWDPDVNPEGVYELYRFKGSDVFQPFIHLGQMVVNEKDFDSDAMLYLNQLGFDWRIGPVRWTLAGSYYSWSNLANSRWLDSADYRGSGGNTFVKDPATGLLHYKYDYKLWEAISFVRFDLWNVPVKLGLDYIVNSAEDVPTGESKAYNGYVLIGKEEKKGDLSLYYQYALIGKNAVIGGLNDQDFYGANRKGHKIAAHYMLFDRAMFRVAFFYTDPVTQWDPNSPTFGKPYYDQNRMHEDRLQTDLIFKF